MINLPKCLLRHIFINYIPIITICKLYKISKQFDILTKNDKQKIESIKCSNDGQYINHKRLSKTKKCSCGENYKNLTISETEHKCEQCNTNLCKKCIYEKEFVMEHEIRLSRECNKCNKTLCVQCSIYCAQCAIDNKHIGITYCEPI